MTVTATFLIELNKNGFYYKSVSFVDDMGQKQYFCEIISESAAEELRQKGYKIIDYKPVK